MDKGENMAIWQVPILLTRKENTENYLDNNLCNFLDELQNFFPEEKSWCHSIIQYGKLDSTCIEIDIEDDVIIVRIDLRNITKEQLEIIIKFAVSNELKIKYKSEAMEPNISNFIKILKTSDAYRFLDNPEKYLKSIITDV